MIAGLIDMIWLDSSLIFLQRFTGSGFSELCSRVELMNTNQIRVDPQFLQFTMVCMKLMKGKDSKR